MIAISRTIVLSLVFFQSVAIAWAGIYSEDFSTTTYKHAATTADWSTTRQQVLLNSSYQFSQPGGLANWGGQIRAIHHNGQSGASGVDKKNLIGTIGR